MATKSKKSKAFQMKWKALGTILFFICAISVFFCGVVTVNISKEWSRDVINADTVYDTAEFQDFFHKTLDHVVLADVYYQNEDRIEAGKAVDREELISGFKRYYGIMDGVITGNTEINETYDGLIIYGEIPESLQANLAEYQELVETSLPSYYKMYIQRQLDEYKSSVRYLEEQKNFLYYIEDEKGNIVSGNATRGEIGEAERTLVLSAGFSSDHLGKNPYYFNTYTNTVLEESNYKFYGAVRDPLLQGDAFYDMWQDFTYAKQSLPILFAVFVVSLVGAIICLIHLIRVTGQKERYGKVQLAQVDRIYNEVHFLLVLLYALGSTVAATALLDVIMAGTVQFWSYVFTTILGAMYLAALGIGLSYALSVSRQVKDGSFFRNTWISASICRMSELFTGKTFRGWMVIVMLCYGLGNCAIMGAMVLAPIHGYVKMGMLFGIV
ncbi:MAG: hypothetical protein IKT48_07015, partial [Anaerotignum sp.]|nr:hypothetical protein [Anaerotignum sp.]